MCGDWVVSGSNSWTGLVLPSVAGNTLTAQVLRKVFRYGASCELPLTRGFVVDSNHKVTRNTSNTKFIYITYRRA